MSLGITIFFIAHSSVAITWPSTPDLGKSFWQHWGDGNAELTSYDLDFPRYGKTRQGQALTIFVTETFLKSKRVKSNSSTCCTPDEFPVMKLNQVLDFPTGIYDYNLMTSTFIGLAPHPAGAIGTPTKITFSSQEWCGQVFHQLLFNRHTIQNESHSYFQGEADRATKLDHPKDGISEDTLFHWARGLAAPSLKAGQTSHYPLLPSLTHSRLNHAPLAWSTVRLTRSSAPQRITVPAGTFEAWILEARSPHRTWTFHVNQQFPHQIVQWTTNHGQQARMVKSVRLKYWQLNHPEAIHQLSKLGLSARPSRTP
jgi:hypothetical protein